MRYWLLLACGAGLCLSLGCSNDKRSLEATGNVTYNGNAMSDGEITFIPDDKAVAPEGGKIKDGKYSVKVQPGKYRVEIRANRPTGEKRESAAGPGQTEEVTAPYVPDEYNSKSTLTADVSSGKTKFDFELKGPK